MDLKKYFETQYIFTSLIALSYKIILFFLIIVPGAAPVRLFLRLGELIAAKSITGTYKNLFSDIFILNILIEVVRKPCGIFSNAQIASHFLRGRCDCFCVAGYHDAALYEKY